MKVDFTHAPDLLKEWIRAGDVKATADVAIEAARLAISAAREIAAHPPRILVLDDDEGILDLFRRLFDAKGYDGLYATRATRAAEFCRKDKIDLIICDLMMPDVDGFAFIRTIRRVPETRAVPIMVYSALDARQAIPQLKGSKVDAFVQKPGDVRAIMKRIEEFLATVVKTSQGTKEEEEEE